jgi:hypothetical protein
MTEKEWLNCAEVNQMCWYLRDQRVHYTDRGRRKLRLFACQCCRRVWSSIKKAELRKAVEVSERHADGLASRSDLTGALYDAKYVAKKLMHLYREWDDDAPGIEGAAAAAQAAEAVLAATSYDRMSTNAVMASYYACEALHSLTEDYKAKMAELRVQTDLVRDIFGNPFRPVTFDPVWLTSTAQTLAKQMYKSRDFGAMPILADALQDAGCDNDDILNHCRAESVHVRGCWVVDLVLGKS